MDIICSKSNVDKRYQRPIAHQSSRYTTLAKSALQKRERGLACPFVSPYHVFAICGLYWDRLSTVLSKHRRIEIGL